jgi:hypothetical protein
MLNKKITIENEAAAEAQKEARRKAEQRQQNQNYWRRMKNAQRHRQLLCHGRR